MYIEVTHVEICRHYGNVNCQTLSNYFLFDLILQVLLA